MPGSEGPAAPLFEAIEDVFEVYVRERDLGSEPFEAIGWATGEVLAESDGNKVALYFTTDEGKPALKALLSQLEQAYRNLRS